MRIFVLSRDEIEHVYKKITEECIVISIHCPNDSPAKIEKTNFIKDILFLGFNDVEETDPFDYKPMSKTDAIAVKEFINKFKNKVNTIIVQCDAGVSRSAGVAAAIGKYLNNDDMFIFGAPRYSPNITCYRNVLNAFFGNVGIDEEKIALSDAIFSSALSLSESDKEFRSLLFRNKEELQEWIESKGT